VEMWRRMVIIIHSYGDTEKEADRRHIALNYFSRGF
jgi:hypothetical protein